MVGYKKYAIYTCLTGGYDELCQPLAIDDKFDYICFSNDIKEDRIGAWTIKPIPYRNDDNSRLSRYVKLLPHNALKEYEYSLWIDANIQILNGDFYDMVLKRIAEDYPIYQVPHPFNDCIYDEIRKSYMVRRLSLKDARKQFRHLKEKGFPAHFGLFENGLMLRKHNDERVIRISQKWWDEYLAYSKRDQCSLAYVYWAEVFRPRYLFDESHGIRNVSCLLLKQHPAPLSLLKRNKVILFVGSNLRSLFRYLMVKLFL
ncbi:MAG: DUF616 domain-containing protein [Aeriscardovia sp.]|nr:DUF616 domain-containing protein [Aeriscardovia sp.]